MIKTIKYQLNYMALFVDYRKSTKIKQVDE